MRSRSKTSGLRVLWVAAAVPIAACAAVAAESPGQRSLLDDYGGVVVLTAMVIVIQTALIIVLLYDNPRRRNAELAARGRLSEFAYMNRIAAAGELSASIAHEIKQPLAAI